MKIKIRIASNQKYFTDKEKYVLKKQKQKKNLQNIPNDTMSLNYDLRELFEVIKTAFISLFWPKFRYS